jgi:CRP/FNR family transcriptional regulator, cyclic AMP receptor protein
MKDMFHQAFETPEVKNPGKVLSPATLADLKSLQTRKIYPEGYEFFVRGQSAAGIYILYAGKVRLCVNNSDDKLTIGYALPGDILGLSAVVLGKAYEETAEAALPCRAGFIACKDFLRFLDQHAEAAYWIVQLLSDRVTVAFEQLSTFRDLPCRRATQ